MSVLQSVLDPVLQPVLSSTLAPNLTGRFVTNLALQSQTLQTTWSAVQSSISVNATTGPDGTATAEKLVENSAATQQHRLDQGSITVVSGSVYTFSIFAKAAERLNINMRISGAGNIASSNFNLQAGTITTPDGGGAIGHCTMSNYGGGWYRCSITGTTDATTVTLRINLASTAGSTAVDTYSGDGASGLYLWGAQLEAGWDANTYIPTTNVAVTAEV